MPPASRAFFFFVFVNPQLALWAIDMPPAAQAPRVLIYGDQIQ